MSTIRKSYERTQQVLRQALSSPGAIWMLVMRVACLAGLIGAMPLVFPPINVPSATIALSVVIVAAALHYTATNPGANRARIIGTGIALAVAAALVPLALLVINSQIPVEVSDVIGHLWALMALVAAFTITASRRSPLSSLWRLIVVGVIGGATAAVLLAYPVYAWVYGSFVPGITIENIPLVNSVLALIVALAVGPLAVRWVQPSGWRQRLAVGAAAGTLAGLVVFSALGAPAAGIISSALLYDVALSREGFDTDEWTLKLAVAVNATFPLVYATFWLLVGGGGLMGGLTALVRLRSRNEAATTPSSDSGISWSLIALLASTPLAVVVVANAVLFSLLGTSIQNIFNNFGYTGSWQPQWIIVASIGQSWLALTLTQILALRGLRRQDASSPSRQLRAAAYFSGVTTLLGVVLMIGATQQTWWVLVLAVITAALSIELLVMGWRLGQWIDESAPALKRSGWATAGAAAGLFAGIFALQLAGITLDLVLIQVPLIVDLAETSAPAPGVEWLHRILATAFGFQVFFASALVIVITAVMALIGDIATRWHWRKNVSRPVRILRWSVGLLIGVPLLALLLSWTVGFAFVAAFFTLMILRGPRSKRLTWPLFALAFVLAAAGFIALWSNVGPQYQTVVYVAFAVVAVVANRALMTYTPAASRSRMRLLALIGLALLAGLLSYLSQPEVITLGGVTRFDGQRWDVFNSENSKLGRTLNYELSQDSAGNMWFSSGSGVIVRQSGDDWIWVQIGSTL
ncbi:MAG: hypothetical protein H7175_09380, partial [Burkholderiales bacterium]|nr:hypothetical protein [Anaerolineae bacterium]